MNWQPQTVIALVIVVLVLVVFWMKNEKESEKPKLPERMFTLDEHMFQLDNVPKRTEKMESVPEGMTKLIFITSDACSDCIRMESLLRRQIMTKPEFMTSILNVDTDMAAIPGIQSQYAVNITKLPALISENSTGITMRNGIVAVQTALTDFTTW